MSENLEQLVKKYHAFFDVSPYYVVIEEKHGSPIATRHTTPTVPACNSPSNWASQAAPPRRGLNPPVLLSPFVKCCM
jgi:hypothetical protein